mmetsp:Transcript_19675/g.31419  ORF Transcript_19675/g.31419 Transcript_19675/m.31419 type:complete len:158 (-) Transcript_19675:9-482(-)
MPPFRRRFMPIYTNRNEKEDDTFNTFHCKRCRAHLVITDIDLADVPRRRTDGAIVLDARKQVVKLYTKKREGHNVVRREKGAERQFMHEEDLEMIYLSDTAVVVPWHRMKNPWVCKVCGYICQSEADLEKHRKQRQHTIAMENDKEAENEMKPIIVG